MRGLRSCPRAFAASAFAVALLAGSVGAAPWHAHYERGVRLLRDGDAAKAEAELRAALAGRPHAGCRVRIYGVKYRDYIPHYELGMALLGLGRDSEAAVEFSLEMADGVIDSCAGTREQALTLREHVARLALADAPAAQAESSPATEASPPPQPPAASAPMPSAAGATQPEPAHPPNIAGQPAAATASAPPSAASRNPGPAIRTPAASVDPRSLLQLSWSASMHGPPAILHVTRP